MANERELKLRYRAACCWCSAALPPGTQALWDSAGKTARCLTCAVPAQSAPPVQEALPVAAALPQLDRGQAGASAQRRFDALNAARRARIRAHWWVLLLVATVGGAVGVVIGGVAHANVILTGLLGATVLVTAAIKRPQHIGAWRSGAEGERLVGRALDNMRAAGVIALHDRRMPQGGGNIDHIAVAPSGVFVIDTKNNVGRVRISGGYLSVAGRRSDHMVDGVLRQLTAVNQVIARCASVKPACLGVLCFPKAELPVFIPSLRGLAVVNPRRLRRLVMSRRRMLTPEQVEAIATMLAHRLPPA
jgi:hypothetical protein